MNRRTSPRGGTTGRRAPSLARAAAALLCATLLAVACDSPSDPDRREPAAIAVVGGANQTGAAGQELPVPISVTVTDASGRPVSNKTVTFHVTAGGGHVFSDSAKTNAEGIAQERWTLGTQIGLTQTLEARVVNGSGATLTATVNANVQAGPAAHITRVNPPGTFGGVVNSVLADTLAVKVTDALGNPVAGATVNWSAPEGGGSTTAATSVSDANGIARMTWRLGPATNVVQVAGASLAGETVAFNARAADTITVLQGSGITVWVGVPITASVSLSGGSAGPVPGVTVQWQATSGGGTVNPAVSKTSSNPDALGIASTQWTPGPTPGTQTLTATAGTLTATLTVTVLPAATRTLLTTVPGRPLDATSDRVLWLDEAGGTGAFRVRTLATGTDAVIAVDAGAPPMGSAGGWLFSGGALVRTQGGLLYEWHNDGTLVPLGAVDGQPSVEGDWAAWSTGSQVIQRNLGTGTNTVILGTGATSVDVGADGDVVYLGGGGPALYSGGVTTPVTEGGATRIATDGVNVVYLKVDAFANASLYLDNGASDIGLAGHSSKSGGVIYYRLNGGWTAYNTPLMAVTRRSPGGAVQQLTTETTGKQVVALASDGTVIYADLSRGRYFLVTPAGVTEDAGPSGAVFFVHGSQIFEAQGGAVYRVTA